MTQKYVKITRSDVGEGASYIQPVHMIGNAVEGELEAIEYLDNGTTITLEVIEMRPDEYEKLPEFGGW